jgi:predicted dehydrogenase
LDKIDAVSIAVPTNKHYEVAKDFIKQGIHVLIEKPITNNLIQAKELVKLAKKNKVILQVGHVERFNSAFTAIEYIVDNPRFIECHRLSPFPHRSLDIGVVLDVMIHDIDIILGLVKSNVQRVEAVGVPVLTFYEDIANVRLVFKNGCVCNLTASRISEEAMRKIRIFLADAYISLDYVNQEASLYKKENGQIIKNPLPIEKEEPLKKEIESFIDCVINHKKPLVSGLEAYQALKLANQILRKIWHTKRYL